MQRRRVLIVDDQRDVRRMLRAALETLGAGISITDVPSGEEAILVISRQPVDLLISDVRLPGISGLELIERTRVRNPELHLILITGMTDDATHQQLEKAMADAYFFKPIQIGEFLDAVQELMGLTHSKPAASPAPAPQPTVIAPPPSAETVLQPAAELPALAQSGLEALAPQGPSAAQPLSRLLLEELRQRLGAILAALVNRQGETLDLSGEIAAEIDEWVAVLRLVSGVVELGGEHARTLIFAPGSRVDFWITPVAPDVTLVIGAEQPAWRTTAFGELIAILSSAAADLRAVSEAGELAPADPSGADAETLQDDATLQSLDALFASLERQPGIEVDVNAFWDTAAEDHNVPGEREGGMTYEEARRLGLAPDED